LQKIKNTEKKEINLDKYKIAIVDEKEQPIGNFRIEPPGIFLGRGDNPKIGKIKKRIYPEDITINIGKESKIPETLDGHKWGNVIHDRTVEWIASWKDDITGKTKYVWLGDQSDFKANSDMYKFELARKLKNKIKLIEKENEINLDNSSIKIKQIATALYFIDKLALRVGNEKSSEETDTVGVTSLRFEHVKLLENNNIILDFLGKDSVRYYNNIQIDNKVYKNLEEFLKNKNIGDQLFDLINTPPFALFQDILLPALVTVTL
jgi:DNA topoisomerase-1